jgi:hypothetical protein
MNTMDKQKFLGYLKQSLKDYKKAKSKRHPENAQDAMAYHICDSHIVYLNVEISMIENGMFDVKL